MYILQKFVYIENKEFDKLKKKFALRCGSAPYNSVKERAPPLYEWMTLLAPIDDTDV
jgi:hypothetical protein